MLYQSCNELDLRLRTEQNVKLKLHLRYKNLLLLWPNTTVFSFLYYKNLLLLWLNYHYVQCISTPWPSTLAAEYHFSIASNKAGVKAWDQGYTR